jgi:hypothetical protein
MTERPLPFSAPAIIASIVLNAAVISALVMPGPRPALTTDIVGGNEPMVNKSTADSITTGNIASTEPASAKAGSAEPSAPASAGSASTTEPPSVSAAPSPTESAPKETAPAIAASEDASQHQHVSYAKSHRVPKHQVAGTLPPGGSSGDVAPTDQAPGPLVAPERATPSDERSAEFNESPSSSAPPAGPSPAPPFMRPLRLVPPPVPQPP